MNNIFTLGHHSETAWSKGFTLLLTLFAAYVESEQDLEFIQHNDDLSLTFWQRDKDAAEARFVKALDGLQHLPVRLPEDRSLQRFTCLVSRMLDNNDPMLPRQLHREMKACFFHDFQVRGFGPIAQHRNALLIQARHMVDAMIALPFFDYLPEDEFAPSEWEEAEGPLLVAI
jgi:hypothetical protein